MKRFVDGMIGYIAITLFVVGLVCVFAWPLHAIACFTGSFVAFYILVEDKK